MQHTDGVLASQTGLQPSTPAFSPWERAPSHTLLRLEKVGRTQRQRVRDRHQSHSSLTAWLVDSSETLYGKQLSRDAAALMVELAGTGLGLLEQELGKLSSYVGDRPRITPEDVRQMVGGWKAETTWTMLDAVRDGDPGTALGCLEKLLTAGEAGPKLLGGVSFVFRKLADATERSREGVQLPAALKDAGVFFRDIEKAERYLRRVKRPRAEKILARLLKADSDLKGGSQLSDRLQMELLLLWLSGAETH